MKNKLKKMNNEKMVKKKNLKKTLNIKEQENDSDKRCNKKKIYNKNTSSKITPTRKKINKKKIKKKKTNPSPYYPLPMHSNLYQLLTHTFINFWKILYFLNSILFYSFINIQNNIKLISKIFSLWFFYFELINTRI